MIALLQFSGRAFCASLLVSTSALAYRPAPYRRLHPAPLTPSVTGALSFYQRLICQTLSGNASHEAIEPSERVVLNIAFVQAEGKFINIAAKMLLARMMIDADKPALENRENAFDTVCSNIVAGELSSFVIDRCMVESQHIEALICASFIRVNCGTGFDLPNDCSLHRTLVTASDGLGDNPAAALAHSQDRSLADRATPGITPLRGMFIFFEAANICFVDFDNATQFLKVGTARLAKPMQKEPGRLLRDPDFLGELQARNALARRHKQIHRINPLVQGHMRALEYRSGADREILFALITAIEAFFACRNSLAKTADRAMRTLWPKPTFNVNARRLFVREFFEQFEG